jgi:molybdate transport system substrate-binding protein
MKRAFGRLLLAAFLSFCVHAEAADLTVSAAASLQNAFTEIGKVFEKANPGNKVLFNFGSSGSLLQQISRGAPVDVFATADLDTMNRAQDQNLIVRDTRTNFVANKLVLVAPADSAAGIQNIADLTKPDVKRIGIGTPESVPAGRYAKEALELAGLWDTVQPRLIFGQNVRQVLDYVARGEVDAGFVYATDAAAVKDRVRVVADAPVKGPILYPISVVKGGGNEKLARAFVAYVNSDAGRRVLEKYGFLRP